MPEIIPEGKHASPRALLRLRGIAGQEHCRPLPIAFPKTL